MEWVLVLVLVAAVGWLVLQQRQAGQRRRLEARNREEELEDARRTAEEDVVRFGEELQALDVDVKLALASPDSAEAMRQDWQRALDGYESADRSLRRLSEPSDIRHVTEALEDGRYAVACVLARRDGRPLPQRRPPCFFNPAHGPSAVDVEWAPPGGQPRQVPVCAADADRVAQGAEPAVRTVPQGAGRVPYWEAGPAYSPWASGYFGAYAATGLLPAFMLGTLLAPGWDGTPADGFDTAGTETGAETGADAGGDAGDGGGDGGGEGGGDWGGGDAGGDWGGGDWGGGDWGGGGFDGGF